MVKKGTNVIADSTAERSRERIAGPATLRKLPNLVSQLSNFTIVWSFWSDVLVYDKLAKFGRIDMA